MKKTNFWILLLLPALADAYFSAGFRRFLVARYGNTTAEQLERRDLGILGSFGGSDSSELFELA